jgi:ATP-dependent DNA ligase
VWKRLDQPYEPGRRVRHWLKRKQGVEVEAFVTGFKPGTPDRGNGRLVGALEFSIAHADGTVAPVAWVSNWTDEEREAMTRADDAGNPALNPAYRGRRAAVVAGHDVAARSRRIRLDDSTVRR